MCRARPWTLGSGFRVNDLFSGSTSSGLTLLHSDHNLRYILPNNTYIMSLLKILSYWHFLKNCIGGVTPKCVCTTFGSIKQNCEFDNTSVSAANDSFSNSYHNAKQLGSSSPTLPVGPMTVLPYHKLSIARICRRLGRGSKEGT